MGVSYMGFADCLRLSTAPAPSMPLRFDPQQNPAPRVVTAQVLRKNPTLMCAKAPCGTAAWALIVSPTAAVPATLLMVATVWPGAIARKWYTCSWPAGPSGVYSVRRSIPRNATADDDKEGRLSYSTPSPGVMSARWPTESDSACISRSGGALVGVVGWSVQATPARGSRARTSLVTLPLSNDGLQGLPLPRLDVIDEVVVSQRGARAGRHAHVGRADEPPVVKDRDTVRRQEIEPVLDRARRHCSPSSRGQGARRVGGLERDRRVAVLLGDGLLQSSRTRVPRPRLGWKVHPHSRHVLRLRDKAGSARPGRRRRIGAGDDGGDEDDNGGSRESHG